MFIQLCIWKIKLFLKSFSDNNQKNNNEVVFLFVFYEFRYFLSKLSSDPEFLKIAIPRMNNSIKSLFNFIVQSSGEKKRDEKGKYLMGGGNRFQKKKF